jgi:hypothetical protein
MITLKKYLELNPTETEEERHLAEFAAKIEARLAETDKHLRVCMGWTVRASELEVSSGMQEASLPTQRTGSDCFSACLSWLLKLPQDEVPDFTDPEDPNSGKFYHNVADFLNARGLRMMMIEWRDLPAMLGGPVIARGTSPREKAHAVLWDDDGLMHDPHPSRDGLVGEPTHAMLILSHNVHVVARAEQPTNTEPE